MHHRTHRSPGLERALAFLRARGPGRQPSLRKLAAAAGVSYVTMWKAAAALRAGRASDSLQPAPPLPEPGYRWQQVRTRVEHDVIAGAFPAGTALPSAKELASRYGVCHRTLTKALASLVAGGALVREQRSLLAPTLSPVRRSGKVLLVARVDPSAGAAAMPLRKQVLFRAAEIECSRAGVRLEVVPLGPDSAPDPALPIDSSTLGCLALTGDMGEPRVGRLMAALAAAGRPVALLDETGEAVRRGPRPSSRRMAVFSLANSAAAGRLVGRFLLALGHRRVAYISPANATVWSRNRLAGLREAFSAAGPQAEVLACTDDTARDIRPRELRWLMERALDHSLARSGVTAWVALSDPVALACRPFLTASGRHVPGDVSLVSFDDSLDAFFHQLTSYNFNCEAVVHAMVASVLGPPRPGARTDRTLEIPGFVSVRSSSGTVRSPVPDIGLRAVTPQ